MFYDLIYRYFVFPYRERRSRRHLPARLKVLEHDLSQSLELIRELQNHYLRRLIDHAYSHSSYWRHTFDTVGVNPASIRSADDLAQLPILEKLAIRSHLEEVSSSAFTNERQTATTGGSTAAPTLFYRDPSCSAFREAVRAYFWQSIGKSPTDRWANLWGASRDFGGSEFLKLSRYNKLTRRVLMLPANHLSEATAPSFFDQLREFRPVLLHGYSQALHLLARFAERLGIQLPDSVVAITATAEPLYENQKQAISNVFQVPVYRVYGTREFGFLGGELPGCSGLQINPLNAIVEIVDSSGNQVPPGEHGQLVVTDLQNLATPFIRYRIGDIGSWTANPVSKVGFQSLNIDAGRETDFIVANDGRFICGAGLTLIGSPEVDQLQYQQNEQGKLLVRFVSPGDPATDSLENLEEQIRRVVGDLTIRFERVPEIPRTASGKLQYVYSEIARRALGLESHDSTLAGTSR